MDRRLFLRNSGVLVLGQALGHLALPGLLGRALAESLAGAATARPGKALVVIFQRGAVDGLSMVPPLADSHYNRELRPTILIPSTGDDCAVPLDGFFGLHPALAPLAPYWSDGRLAILHQVGSPSPTRSHFDAQDFMESGTPGVKSTEDGFLNRAVLQLKDDPSPLQAVALQPSLPRSLWGTSGAIAMSSIQELANAGPLARSGMEGGFESLYDSAMDEALRGAGHESFLAIQTLSKLSSPLPLSPSPGASAYPKSPLGKRLSEISRLLRARIGVRIAVTECGGWDTHQRQGAGKGQLAGHLKDFGDSIAAFAAELGPALEDVCLVTVTEFGRTAKENGNGGTDHGHGSVMLVLGGNVRGKRVIARWKSLAPENLFEGRDLPVTTDFRDVWREILGRHLGVARLDGIFPGFPRAPGKPWLFPA